MLPSYLLFLSQKHHVCLSFPIILQYYSIPLTALPPGTNVLTRVPCGVDVFRHTIVIYLSLVVATGD
jgi:hypothetical protein